MSKESVNFGKPPTKQAAAPTSDFAPDVNIVEKEEYTPEFDDDDDDGVFINFEGSDGDDLVDVERESDSDASNEDESDDDDSENDDYTERSESEDYEDDDDDGDFNPTLFMAKGLKEKGDLPEDFEIPDDVSFDDLLVAVRSHVRGNAYEEARQEAIEDITSRYSEEDLLFVRAHRQGADPTTFNTVERMRQYGNVDVASADTKVKEQLVESMYTLQGMAPEDAKILVKAKKDSLDVLAEQAQKAHATGFNNWKTNVDTAAQQQEAKKREDENLAISKVNEIITTRKVGNIKMSPEQTVELRRDLYEAHETVVHEGKTYPITAVNKFLHEFRNDVALQLEAYMLMKNKDLYLSETKRQGRTEIEEEMRKAAQKVSRKKPQKKKSKNLSDDHYGAVTFG